MKLRSFFKMLLIFYSWNSISAQHIAVNPTHLSDEWEWTGDFVNENTGLWRPFVLKESALFGPGALWLRRVLPNKGWSDPCIELRTTATNFEVYLDEKLIYQFEYSTSLEPYAGVKTHRFATGPLGPHSLLRIHVQVGANAPAFLLKKASIGSELDMLLRDIRKELDNYVISFLLMIVGIYSLALFIQSPKNKMFIAFAIITIPASIYLIISSSILQLYFLKNTAWVYIIEVFSLYAIPIGVLAFVEMNFRSKYMFLINWLWKIQIGFIFSVFVAVQCQWTSLRSTLPLFYYFVVLDIALVLSIITRSATWRNRRARMLWIALFIFSLCGLYDIMAYKHLIPRVAILSSWGVLFFVFVTGYVMELRFESWFVQKEKEKLKRREAEFRANEAEMQAKIATAQTQMIQLDKMASLGQLTAGIAHEIKNPLNFVNNFSELTVELSEELNEKIDKYSNSRSSNANDEMKKIIGDLVSLAEKINEHGKRADSIVKGMLLHAHAGAREREATDINVLLDEYLKLSYHGFRARDKSFNIAMISDYDPAIPVMNVVPQDLSRVFSNLIANGCYATHQKKKRLGEGFMPEINVSTRKLENQKVEIRIRDNGDGIAMNIRDRIFNPFFTTKPAREGTGLGLSISYDIVVNEHKGDIRVESKEGEYAEFIVTLPVDN